MAISSNFRQILYSFNTNFLLVNFVFVKKEKKIKKERGATDPQPPPSPHPYLDPPLGSGKCSSGKFWKFNKQERRFSAFLVNQVWRQMRARAVQAMASFQI